MKAVNPEPRDGYRFIEIAKDQPQYITLPANVSPQEVETKWKFSWQERLCVLLFGNLYLTILTFGMRLQPLRLSVTREPDYEMSQEPVITEGTGRTEGKQEKC